MAKIRVEDIITPWKALGAICLAITFVGFVQGVVYSAIKGSTEIWSGECTPTRWEGDEHPTAFLRCGDMKDEVRIRGKVVTAYLNNPGPLTCKVFKDNSATCDERPAP